MKRRTRWTGCAAMCLWMAAGWAGSARGGEAPAAETAQTAKDPEPWPPVLAAYRWGAANANGGAKAVDAFGQWIGDPDAWAEDFEAIERWDNNIAGGNWQLPEWGAWKKKNPVKRRLILSVPLLPGGWDRSGSKADHEKGPVSHAQGAKGEYNRHFENLAKMLIEHGLDDTILRLGWEMNGGWYAWRAQGEEKDFAEYFRQIVTTMRKVEGAEKLRFCWNPAMGWQQFPADQCYPGDEYVDYIGVDIYDDSWGQDTYPLDMEKMSAKEIAERRDRAWDAWIYGGQFGIKWYIDFAKQHGKPLCFPEWGVSKRADNHGGLDNPKFIERMHEIIMNPDNNVAWHCYFDVEAHDGGHQLSPGLKGDHKTTFPRAAQRFRALFGPVAKERAAKPKDDPKPEKAAAK